MHLAAAVCWALAALSSAHCRQVRKAGVDTLVLYVFRHTDTESDLNLKYFFDHGLKEGDGAHYYVLIQDSNSAEAREVCSEAAMALTDLSTQHLIEIDFQSLRSGCLLHQPLTLATQRVLAATEVRRCARCACSAQCPANASPRLELSGCHTVA